MESLKRFYKIFRPFTGDVREKISKKSKTAARQSDDFLAQRGSGGNNVVNLSRKSSNYKFMRMQKPFVIP